VLFRSGESVWAAVKQVIVKVLASPFRAIGRLFTGGREDKVEEISVHPVTFAPGSAVVGPAGEGHLKRVADFLRGAPAIKLAMAPVITGRDIDSIKTQEIMARVQKLQRERGIPDFNEAIRAYLTQEAPTITPPQTTREQMALLRQREPTPQARIDELSQHRVEAARDVLVKVEGIAADRLPVGGAKPVDTTGDGRVEFTITAE